jgi:aerobic-type carbon monoxide dehydrogenase small subunit (CoxS/CutS family)
MKNNRITIQLTVNRTPRTLSIEPHETLLEILRDRLGLTGPKKCCGEGECGACTVILDGKSVNSCLILAAETDGCGVVTIEGITDGGKLSSLQQAFLDEGAVQCGFCTPGMIVQAHYLLTQNPDPSDGEIKEGMSGNLCRCTGYSSIIKAVKSAAKGGYGS